MSTRRKGGNVRYEVVFRFPSVVSSGVVLPFDPVENLSFDGLVVGNRFNGVLLSIGSFFIVFLIFDIIRLCLGFLIFVVVGQR